MPLSIHEAVKAGVERLRLDKWANPDDRGFLRYPDQDVGQGRSRV